MTDLTLASLTAKVEAAYARIAAADRPEVWIHLRPKAEVLAEVAALAAAIGNGALGIDLPLAGKLFAVKGNVDLAGYQTTAACPTFGEVASDDATAVARLREAGAVPLGATNLDQFATGLVGQRSPYGAVRHAFLPGKISGGSSSGSAVATSLGIVDFALGTDTAGSGRVPAAFHGLIGIKPTRGLISNKGVVPACRSLDVVTVMAADLALAAKAAEVMTGFDAADPLSRAYEPQIDTPLGVDDLVIGVPKAGQIGQLAPGWAARFDDYIAELAAAGFKLVEVDIAPLLRVATMLYEGAFVAERYAAVGQWLDAHLDDLTVDGTPAIDPTVGKIISNAKNISAARLYGDFEELDTHRAYSERLFAEIDALLLPTTVELPTQAEVAAEPIAVNSRLGRFTNFANLLDLSAIAVPAGKVGAEPFGVQFVARAFADEQLVEIAALTLETQSR
jgi:allophanate hydrolase